MEWVVTRLSIPRRCVRVCRRVCDLTGACDGRVKDARETSDRSNQKRQTTRHESHTHTMGGKKNYALPHVKGRLLPPPPPPPRRERERVGYGEARVCVTRCDEGACSTHQKQQNLHSNQQNRQRMNRQSIPSLKFPTPSFPSYIVRLREARCIRPPC